MLLSESSLEDLYKSTVLAFPRTTMRQYATHSIIIKELSWLPFKGMKTLFIKGRAQNEEREYNPIVLLKRVNYNGHQVTITATDGLEYSFDRLSLEHTDALIRCNCKDFGWRFRHQNHLHRSLYGSDGKPYQALYRPGSSNPLRMEGMCKHLIKLVGVLDSAGIFVGV
jgi:hypothetical protein